MFILIKVQLFSASCFRDLKYPVVDDYQIYKLRNTTSTIQSTSNLSSYINNEVSTFCTSELLAEQVNKSMPKFMFFA